MMPIKRSADKNMNDSQQCPICKTEVKSNPRYPTYLCADCATKVSDEKGRKLTISNASTPDGIEVMISDTGEIRESRECYVDGIKCRASESRFGGVVIQTI
ncbi:MAG: hypothetical protein WCH86_05655 [Kiritimatiellales bacterium]